MLVEFRYRFEAAHRFLKSDSKACMTPHGHSWYATLGLGFVGSKLNTSQMTVEFSEIKKDWRKLIQDTFDHSYLHNKSDPIVEILQTDNSNSRLVPFPGDPTTEIISLFLFHKMQLVLNESPYKDLIKVNFLKIEETPTNSITCTSAFYRQEIVNYKAFDGWWNTIDIGDRSFRVL